MTQIVSKTLAEYHKISPKYYSNIIEISSKYHRNITEIDSKMLAEYHTNRLENISQISLKILPKISK